MAKLPEAGKVKTRLGTAISAEAAAHVHREFLRHVSRRLQQFDPAELVVCFDPAEAGGEMRDLLSDTCSATYLAQRQGDLGQRMAQAAREIGELHRRMLFIGVDSPDVPDAHLEHAAALTLRVSVSLGPTEDGGYWSLGLWNEVDADALLSNISWSSGQEARQTLENAAALSYASGTSPHWDDIDRPRDLARLLRRLNRSRKPDDQMLLQRLTRISDGVAP